MGFASKSGLAALLGALLAGAALVGIARAADTYTGYRVSKVIPLPGKKPDWDHISVDPENRNVFIGRADAGVTVYNIDTGEVKQISRRPKAPTVSPSLPSSGSA
jgi:hypothetical protein